jgi:hypothetical protein
MEIGRSTDDESKLGDPRLTQPRDLSDALAKVGSQNRAWLKRYDEIWQHGESSPPALPLGEMDARQVSGRLKEERERLARLAAAVKALQRRLVEVENSLPRQERSSATSKGPRDDRRSGSERIARRGYAERVDGQSGEGSV